MNDIALISISFLIGVGFTIGAEVIGFVTWFVTSKRVSVVKGEIRPEDIQEDDEVDDRR